MGILLSLFMILVCAALCHHLAALKNTDPVFWGVMGILFGPFAIPFVLLAKPRSRQ